MPTQTFIEKIQMSFAFLFGGLFVSGSLARGMVQVLDRSISESSEITISLSFGNNRFINGGGRKSRDQTWLQ